MSTISASTTSNTAFKVTSDTTGTLVLQTGAVPTTAISIDASQVVSIGSIAVTGVTTFSAGSAAAPSITTTGDTNTGIFFPAADTIGFTEGGVEALRINSSGNVGIGTASPQNQLVVSNAGAEGLEIIATGGSPNVIAYNRATSAYAPLTLNGSVHILQTSGTERARLDSSGNLGLGVTPSAWSQFVAFEMGARGNSISSYNSGGVYVGSNCFFNGTNWIYKISSVAPAQYYATEGLHAWQTAAAGTAGNAITFSEKMRLDASGNLLVGTTSAISSCKVSIFHSGNSQQLALSGASQTGIQFKNLTSGDGWIIGRSLSGSNSNDFFIFDHVNSATRFFIGTTGNVGIGATSPDQKLVVDGGATSTYLKVVGQSVNSFFGQDSTGLAVYQQGNKPLYFATNDTERARITSVGDFLVGKTATGSGFEFSVSGTQLGYDGGTYFCRSSNPVIHVSRSSSDGEAIMFFRGNSSTVGNIAVTTTSTAYNTSSDYRLKDNIAPADNSGSVIDAIEVVKHDWKAGGHTRYGMIAQDLHSVAPEAVSVGDADDVEDFKKPWGVDYSKLVPMMMKELQSLRKRVAELESE